MCGIAGIFNLDGEPVSPIILKKMTDVIAHRGPDGEGQYINSFFGIGHRRLAIIDLTPAGDQPIVSANKQFILSYNGEIYNYQELKTELKRLGHQFHSKTDSEVVLNSWVEWGEDSVYRFNGMFAFSIWDTKTRTLFLVRDRYGIKPIYYASWDDTFLFGSEQKAILEHPKARKVVDKSTLLEYFTFQNIFTYQTLLENIRILPPASIGKIKYGRNKNLRIRHYWDYHFEEPKQSKDKYEYQDELNRLVKQAVSRQLVTDVELGSYLSGGLDSGTLTAIASKQLSYMKTFTCGFDLSSASGLELAYDERKKAEAMSAIFKTEHYEMVLKAGDMERCLGRLAYYLEEPRVGQSYPNYYVAQLASKFVKVVLSGSGGDELLGGYPWRYYRAAINNSFDEYINKYYLFWQRLIPNKEIKNVFKPIWDDVKNVWTKDIFRGVFSNHENQLKSPEDYINHSMYFEAKTFLHGLLVVEDKLSMSHSLETRVPFLDNDLVDFALKCPVKLKLNNLTELINVNENDPGGKKNKYFKKSNDGKQILRNVMKNYVPESVTTGEKQGFSSPDSSWFKGESIDFVKNRLTNKNSMIYEYMEYNAVKNLLSDHLNGRNNRRLLIWSLLNFDEFLNKYQD